jgi:hypothetical protein
MAGARLRGRLDRMTRLFAAARESGQDTFETSTDVRYTAAFGV